MHLFILGALPPPRGGVTTHIERLIPYLEKEGIGITILDHSKVTKKEKYLISLRRNPLKALFSLIRPGAKVLHCPLSNIGAGKLLFLLFIKLIGVHVTITLVASPKYTIGNSNLRLFYMLKLARAAFHVIATNGDFKKILVNKGISDNKISVVPAFIPFNNNSKRQVIPQDIIEFCTKRKPLIITYAHGPDFHKGEDLYGLDLLVQLAQELKIDLPRLGIVIVVSGITNEAYLKELRVKIQESGLEPFFCFVIGDHFAFVPFLQYADLFVRATNTDGDALTLREALYCGVPSVASDVCRRPEGTFLFRNRDAQDLCRVAREVLKNKRQHPDSRKIQQVNNAETFINIFKRVALPDNKK